MSSEVARRRLIFHGILLFFLGLVVGLFVQSMRNPRMGLSAHVSTLLSGIFLALLGAVWRDVNLTERIRGTVFWLALYAMYVSPVGLVLAAVFGTGLSTPLIGAGFHAAAWQEALVGFTTASGGAAALLCCVGALWGLRGHALAP